MSKGQDNGTTILLGLKDYSMGEVVEREESIVVKIEVNGTIKCPHCGSVKLYRHGVKFSNMGNNFVEVGNTLIPRKRP
jgi:transposase